MSLKSLLLPERQVPDTYKEQLDREIGQALAQRDLPIDTKYQLYQNIMHQYKQLSQQLRKPLQLDFVYENKPSTAIPIDSFPKTLRQRANNLVSFINNIPDIVINERGELVYKHNPIRGSNYIDLVHDFVRDRKRKTRPPPGGRELALALRDANVPHEFIGNKNRWELIDSGPRFFSSTSRPQSGDGQFKWTAY